MSFIAISRETHYQECLLRGGIPFMMRSVLFDEGRIRMGEPYRVGEPYHALLGYQASLAQQWVAMTVAVTHAYVGLFDPRPDLSVPARSIKRPYGWWW